MKIISAKWSSHGTPYSGWAIFSGLLTLFFAAFQEEIMFRGYFSINLSQYGFLWAMFWSSLIFTVFHFITNRPNPYQAVDWFLGGLILYYIYIVSGSIWVSAIVHFARNAVNVLVLNVAQSYSILTFDNPIKPQYKTLYTLIISILWLLLAIYFYGKIKI